MIHAIIIVTATAGLLMNCTLPYFTLPDLTFNLPHLTSPYLNLTKPLSHADRSADIPPPVKVPSLSSIPFFLCLFFLYAFSILFPPFVLRGLFLFSTFGNSRELFLLASLSPTSCSWCFSEWPLPRLFPLLFLPMFAWFAHYRPPALPLVIF